MSLPDHIAGYTERDWQVYELELDDADQPALVEDSTIVWCNSETEMAERVANSSNRLYVDLELLAADRDPSAGAQIGRLAADWRGHPAGQILICTYELLSAGKLVYLLETA